MGDNRIIKADWNHDKNFSTHFILQSFIHSLQQLKDKCVGKLREGTHRSQAPKLHPDGSCADHKSMRNCLATTQQQVGRKFRLLFATCTPLTQISKPQVFGVRCMYTMLLLIVILFFCWEKTIDDISAKQVSKCFIWATNIETIHGEVLPNCFLPRQPVKAHFVTTAHYVTTPAFCNKISAHFVTTRIS